MKSENNIKQGGHSHLRESWFQIVSIDGFISLSCYLLEKKIWGRYKSRDRGFFTTHMLQDKSHWENALLEDIVIIRTF